MSEESTNTDLELWRETTDDYYMPSIHVTDQGEIGINVGGKVIVQTVQEWHEQAEQITKLQGLLDMEDNALRKEIDNKAIGIRNPWKELDVKDAEIKQLKDECVRQYEIGYKGGYDDCRVDNRIPKESEVAK